MALVVTTLVQQYYHGLHRHLQTLYKIAAEIYWKSNHDFISLCAERTVILSRVVAQNSPSMRRIMSEWKRVQTEGLAMGEGPWSSGGNSSDTFRLKPVGNMFEWHFTFLGAKDSPFEGGLYHGSIILPPDYPQSGPSVRLLTPNQRFKVGSRICLSASEYHQETWQPSWTISSLVSALVAHMTEPAVEIGSVQGATPSQKRKAALRSRSFECSACGCQHRFFSEERFPTPKGFRAGEDAYGAVGTTGVGKGRGAVRSRGDRNGVSARGRAGTGAVAGVDRARKALSGRSKLSWAARLMASKPFFVVLTLIIVSLLLNQPNR